MLLHDCVLLLSLMLPRCQLVTLNSNVIKSVHVMFVTVNRLDGVTDYLNLNDTLPEYSTIDVYNDPEIEIFENEIQAFRTYWPYQHTHLNIKVRSGSFVLLSIQNNVAFIALFFLKE